MLNAMHRGVTFVLYQLTLAFGITMMPVALFARRLGVSLPFDRLVEAAGSAYERANSRKRAQVN